jgi:hypothetical protein
VRDSGARPADRRSFGRAPATVQAAGFARALPQEVMVLFPDLVLDSD